MRGSNSFNQKQVGTSNMNLLEFEANSLKFNKKLFLKFEYMQFRNKWKSTVLEQVWRWKDVSEIKWYVGYP